MKGFARPCNILVALLFFRFSSAARVGRSLLADISGSLSTAIGASSKADLSLNLSTEGTHVEGHSGSEATGVHLSPEKLFRTLADANGKVHFGAVIQMALAVTSDLTPHRQRMEAMHKEGTLPRPGQVVLKYLQTVLSVRDDQVSLFISTAVNDELTPKHFEAVCGSGGRLDVLIEKMDLDEQAKQIYFLIRTFGPLPYMRTQGGQYKLDVDNMMNLDSGFFAFHTYDRKYSLWVGVHPQKRLTSIDIWKKFKAIDSEIGDQPASCGIIDWKKYRKAEEGYGLLPISETQFQTIVKVSQGPHVNGLTFDQYLSVRLRKHDFGLA